MSNRSASFLIAVTVVLGGVIAATGQELRQEWQLRQTAASDMLNLRVERWKPGSHSSHSSDVPLSRFRGLSPDVFDRGGRAQFEYTVDAGSLLCQGEFSGRRGVGTFQFRPNPQFTSQLQALGYSAPNDEQLFTMMMTDISLQFARGLRDAGLYPTAGQLIDLRIHGVTAEYVRDTQAAGYRNLSVQDYIEMRIHGVDTDFLRDLRAAGYNLSSQAVIELRIHGVDSEYMRELKAYGLQPPAEDIVQLRIHGVSPEYLKGLKDAGYKNLQVDEITNLRIHGVDTEFIQDSLSLGYHFTPKELTDLRIHGVDGAYLRRLCDSGLKNLTAAQITTLRIHGVD
jgi:hypothetical protein